MTVNSSTWRRLPIADRAVKYNVDDAVARIKEWSKGSVERFASAFLWRDSEGDPASSDSYRLPVGDIVDGRLTMIPRAIFSAGVILSGGHGALEGVVGDDERKKLKGVVSDIYDKLRETFTDPRIVAPWERGGNDRGDVTAASRFDSMPIAETSWRSDDAKARIWGWADGDYRRYREAFLWWDKRIPERKASYRLPIADIVDGELRIVPRAVTAAATMLRAAPGGVDIPDDDIPEVLATLESIEKRWENGMDEVTASVRSGGWSALPLAEQDEVWDESAARSALDEWAGDNISGRYAMGFLYRDPDMDADLKTAYKLPIAMPVDGRLTIFPRAVNNAKARLSQADIPEGERARIEEVLTTIQGRWMDEGSTAALVAAAPIRPPSDWYRAPALPGPTPLVVTADGRVFGHLAAWGVCHAGIGTQCVMAPHSSADYKYFTNGSVLTSDGSMVRVGKITLGTGHADTRLGWIPAADHYDNTGTAIATVASGEDQYGIWVAGSVVPGATEEKIAELRRSPLSGDWRRVGAGLELVAALAVNSPGFPIVASAADGEVMSICAAGLLTVDGELFAAEPQQELAEVDETVLARLAAIDANISRITQDARRRRLTTINASIGESRGM